MKEKQEILTIEPKSEVVAIDYVAMAIEKGADLATIEKFMDLKERHEATEAKKAYVVAMGKFRAEVPTIERTKKAHNSKYAGLAETIAEISEAMINNGLSHSWKTDQDEKSISVTCCVTHVLGHQECTTLREFPDTSGSKNAIQAIGSTVSYLQRYTLFSILGLASKEADTDGSDRVTFEQAEELETLADKAGVDKAKFLTYFQCGSFNHIPAKQYKNALAAIKAKTKKEAKK
jgi:ERF superfamily